MVNVPLVPTLAAPEKAPEEVMTVVTWNEMASQPGLGRNGAVMSSRSSELPGETGAGLTGGPVAL